jgi:hypothetical protein
VPGGGFDKSASWGLVLARSGGLQAQEPPSQGKILERGTGQDFLIGEDSPAVQAERDVKALLLLDDLTAAVPGVEQDEQRCSAAKVLAG